MGQLEADARAYAAANAAVGTAQRAAAARVADARRKATLAREALHRTICDAAVGGMRPTEIAARSGYSREQVRKILRAGGVDPDT